MIYKYLLSIYFYIARVSISLPNSFSVEDDNLNILTIAPPAQNSEIITLDDMQFNTEDYSL